MAFNVISETVKPGIIKLTLSGELDANTAVAFRAELEKAAAQQPKRVVFMMQDLDYMASAGVRVLVFAKQKMGGGVVIFAVAPQESVLETLQLTGLDRALEILSVYDAAKIETL
jgi:anti-anti-sigma factor